METEFELIAKTFQGLENVLAKELTDLGANNIQTGRRMVSFTGDKELMYRANFALRTAIRILKPIKHFKAESADQVYDAVKAIDWNQYLNNCGLLPRENRFAPQHQRDPSGLATEYPYCRKRLYAVVRQFR